MIRAPSGLTTSRSTRRRKTRCSPRLGERAPCAAALPRPPRSQKVRPGRVRALVQAPCAALTAWEPGRAGPVCRVYAHPACAALRTRSRDEPRMSRLVTCVAQASRIHTPSVFSTYSTRFLHASSRSSKEPTSRVRSKSTAVREAPRGVRRGPRSSPEYLMPMPAATSARVPTRSSC